MHRVRELAEIGIVQSCEVSISGTRTQTRQFAQPKMIVERREKNGFCVVIAIALRITILFIHAACIGMVLGLARGTIYMSTNTTINVLFCCCLALHIAFVGEPFTLFAQ